MLLYYFFHPTIALAMARFIVGLRFLSVFDTTGMVIAWAGRGSACLRWGRDGAIENSRGFSKILEDSRVIEGGLPAMWL